MGIIDMKAACQVLALAALGLVSLTGQAALAQPAGCATAGLPAPQVKFVSGFFVFVRPLATVLDPALDDFGINAGGDSLEVYCVTSTQIAVRGNIAVCLSGESCPWR
jgi:hypothetical protein